VLNGGAQSLHDVGPSPATNSHVYARRCQLERQRWAYIQEDRKGEEKEREKDKWSGMQPGMDELWANGTSGKFEVSRKNTPSTFIPRS